MEDQVRDDAKQVRWRVPSVRSSEQGPLVGLAVLLVVSLLTMQSGRDDLMDKVKEEVISEGPETDGGEMLHWPHGGVSGFNGISFGWLGLSSCSGRVVRCQVLCVEGEVTTVGTRVLQSNLYDPFFTSLLLSHSTCRAGPRHE